MLVACRPTSHCYADDVKGKLRTILAAKRSRVLMSIFKACVNISYSIQLPILYEVVAAALHLESVEVCLRPGTVPLELGDGL